MSEFFGIIDRVGLRFAWEPRGAWPEELVFKLFEELQLIHCVDPFKNKQLSGDIRYFHLHGINVTPIVTAKMISYS